MKKIIFEYDFSVLKEILKLNNGGLDFRFNSYPYEDISVETKQWDTIQDFLDWYAENKSKDENNNGTTND